SDVPLGVFLSGGLDSSCIAAQLVDLRQKRGEGDVKSFSVGYRADDGSSELDQARRVAHALGTRHREVLVTAEDFHRFLPDLVWYMDEPIADAVCVPLYYLSKRARDEVVVVLSGEGADEVLAGYPIYGTMLWMEQLRAAAPLASAELPVPFLYHRLIEWAAGLPADVKLRGRTGEWLLRQAARDWLPAECTAPGKRGFTVPVSNWFRRRLHGPLRDALLASDSLARSRFGDKAVRRLLDDHQRGKSDRKEELYALWVLELWRKRFEVGARCAPAPAIQTTKRKVETGMGALRGRDIVCFSNDWDGDPLSKMHAMKILSRQNRVLWVNSIGNRRPTISMCDAQRMLKKVSGAMQGLRERHPNIWVLTPLAIPFYGSELVRAANGALLKAQIQRAMQHLGF